jgi:hypothetical protein
MMISKIVSSDDVSEIREGIFRIVFENKMMRIVRATSVRGEYVIGQIVLSFVYSFYGE